MVPADADDITEQYLILLNELQQFNPELLDKQRILAISKADMLDQELIDEIKPSLPKDIETVFLSSVANIGVMELKDKIWRALNSGG
jgi:GTP-binding protein